MFIRSKVHVLRLGSGPPICHRNIYKVRASELLRYGDIAQLDPQWLAVPRSKKAGLEKPTQTEQSGDTI
jgi:hypothetical protein